MAALDTDKLQNLFEKLQSSSLEFNQQFESNNSEETADVRQCYALFLELGKYLNVKMKFEIKKVKDKVNDIKVENDINLDQAIDKSIESAIICARY